MGICSQFYKQNNNITLGALQICVPVVLKFLLLSGTNVTSCLSSNGHAISGAVPATDDEGLFPSLLFPLNFELFCAHETGE